MNDAGTQQPTMRWARRGVALILGGAVSVLEFAAIRWEMPSDPPPVVEASWFVTAAGLLVGIFVAGRINRARGWRGWFAAGALVIAGWLVGLLVILLVVMSSTPPF